MLKKNVEKALNEQINAEYYSAYLYLSMASYCQAKDLIGMANWFRVQAQEELLHGTKILNYIHDREGIVELDAIAKPPTTWPTSQAAFAQSLEHEQGVTSRINNLVELAEKEKDTTTVTFLQWFVNEQIEEESSVRQILGQLNLIGDNGSGIYLLDRELGTRQFVAPTTAG